MAKSVKDYRVLKDYSNAEKQISRHIEKLLVRESVEKLKVVAREGQYSVL